MKTFNNGIYFYRNGQRTVNNPVYNWHSTEIAYLSEERAREIYARFISCLKKLKEKGIKSIWLNTTGGIENWTFSVFIQRRHIEIL